ncbi:MAG: nucleoside-diphosphate sugar epimerase/dehydratase [Armatimonadetes bacterium]|nr:nucleoside-diphosphate sugar epimerase/dehydratase [Armatimonadota bacterium]
MADAFSAIITLFAAFCIRMDRVPPPEQFFVMYLHTVLPLILCRVAALRAFQVHRIWVRHVSTRDALVILGATSLGSLLFAAYLIASGHTHYPKGVVLVEWMASYFVVAGLRLLVRVQCEKRDRRGIASPVDAGQRRIVLVGAGSMGALLAREIARRHNEGLTLVGFVDDDEAKHQMLLQGGAVLGGVDDLPALLEGHSVDEVVISIKEPTGELVRRVTKLCEVRPVRLRIAPGFQVLEPDNNLKCVRDVAVEDLMLREPVKVDREAIAAYLRGERVLITGGGGSIGGELVRQVAAAGPSELLILGHGENSVFEIEQEMKLDFGVTPTCMICDTRDLGRLRRLFTEHRPSVVFHAAAHKHVPLMESSPEEAITNNVLGTRNLARVATEFGVRRFVMISTDKAVNATSVMGVSKRIAERVIQAESYRSETEFATVRFGNVLGSRGSVIPTMRRQLAKGGPVTVTHPDMKRYFMTIPEAVQLVIQAGALGGNGRIYILDMGKPVRIMDLAHNLIRLSGLVPGKDIEIKITGLRPGEKLFEELLTEEESTTVTRHARIMSATPSDLPVENFDESADALIAAAQCGDKKNMFRLIQLLAPTYKGYTPPPNGNGHDAWKGMGRVEQLQLPLEEAPEAVRP